jgi:hypothetical protein
MGMIRILIHFSGVLLISILAAWCFIEPTVVPVTSLLAAILAYGGFLMKNKPKGKGGKAIVAGDKSNVEMDNHGQVEAGKGGNGGSGGDAILVRDGVKIRITNHGVIKGGDAGE